MNEVSTYQQNTPAHTAGVELATVTTQATQNTVDLVAWASELGAAHQIAQAICSTEFVPKDFRGNPEKTATAILYGKSVGLDPLAALANVFVVHGRPAMYSRTMVALAQRAGVEFRRTAATEQQVTVHARRRGAEHWQEFTWSITRATKAGYTTNAKYKTDPIGMLTAKAFAEAVRILAPDVLMGIAVSEEVELGDYDSQPTAPIEDTAAVEKKKVQRKPRTKKAPEPVAVASAPVEEEPAAEGQTGELISPEAQNEIITQARAKWGVQNPQMLSNELSHHLGVEGITVEQLTVEQGSLILAELAK